VNNLELSHSLPSSEVWQCKGMKYKKEKMDCWQAGKGSFFGWFSKQASKTFLLKGFVREECQKLLSKASFLHNAAITHRNSFLL